MLKMSKASKMPCKSWSLQALDTCAGSVKMDGTLVDACADCYALKGMYRFPVVKAAREHNKDDWKRDGWVADMVKAIGTDPYFRWFDSGDVYSIRLAAKIRQVMEQTPDTKHWLPTRMYKFEKFTDALHDMNVLPNVVVRWSSDSIAGVDLPIMNQQSTIIPHKSFGFDGEYDICTAFERGGKCGDCRMCWDKEVHQVAYVHH